MFNNTLICVRIFILISSILPFSVAQILKRRRSHFEEKAALSNGANDAELYHGKYEKKIKSCAELLRIIQRSFEDSNFEELTLSDLEQTEMQIDAALRHTRARKMQLMLESMNALHEKVIRPKQDCVKRILDTTARIYCVYDNLVWAFVISKLSDIKRLGLATVLSYALPHEGCVSDKSE
ncbi:hypothetical protein OIU74_014209, partial [Salix koriyanagi]